jgi:hypothetical protein
MVLWCTFSQRWKKKGDEFLFAPVGRMTAKPAPAIPTLEQLHKLKDTDSFCIFKPGWVQTVGHFVFFGVYYPPPQI